MQASACMCSCEFIMYIDTHTCTCANKHECFFLLLLLCTTLNICDLKYWLNPHDWSFNNFNNLFMILCTFLIFCFYFLQMTLLLFMSKFSVPRSEFYSEDTPLILTGTDDHKGRQLSGCRLVKRFFYELWKSENVHFKREIKLHKYTSPLYSLSPKRCSSTINHIIKKYLSMPAIRCLNFFDRSTPPPRQAY